MSKIISIGLAEAPYEYTQEEVKRFASELFSHCSPLIQKTIRVFDNAQIERRHFINPKEWYSREHDFLERNSCFVESGFYLSSQALESCLNRVSVSPRVVDHIIFVSSTGISAPTLDALLYNSCGLRADVRRTPIWGLGCLGGAVGLTRAMEFTRAYPKGCVLLIALEICSLAFQMLDHSQRNIIATALFSDGAAAALVVGKEHELYGLCGAELLDSQSTTYPATLGVMGWDMVDTGFKVVLGKEIPSIVRDNIREDVMKLLSRNGLCLGDISLYAAHPGGVKVLRAYEEALDLQPGTMGVSRAVLRAHGNMSSPTVLFVLEEFLGWGDGRRGELGLISAFGPGFGSELLLFEL